MSQAKLKSGNSPLLPASFRLFLHRRFSEIIGFAILMAVMLCAISLATWNMHDPSFNHATSKTVVNWLGFAGATLSDLLLQVFGLAAIIFMLPPLAWSVRFFRHQEITQPARLTLYWLLGTFIASGAISAIPVVGKWPLPSGLGGLTGDLLLAFLNTVPALFIQNSITSPAIGIILAILAFFMTLNACKMHIGEVTSPFSALTEATAELVFRTMGAVTHAGLYTAAFVRRLPMIAKRVKQRTNEAVHEPIMRAQLAHKEEADSYQDPYEDSANSEASLEPEEHKQSVGDKVKSLFKKDSGDEDADRVEPHFEFTSLSQKVEPATKPYNDEYPEEDIPQDEGTGRVTATDMTVKQGKRVSREGQPMLKLIRSNTFELPPVSLISFPKKSERSQAISESALEQNARLLESVLDDYGIRGEIIKVRPGPVVTLYELEPAAGIKSSRVIGLADDIARSMSAISVRIAVIPGRNVIGIEMPNAQRQIVYFRELLASEEFEKNTSELPLILGKTIGGDPVITDLTRMPHLLIAGTTGSGKSVGINTMILSLLFRLSPEQCKLIMIDPKMLELSVYDGIPHLLAPVVTDSKKAVVALKWAVKEMADLMMVAGKDIEGTVQRLAQMARAAGIHLITATQRPSVDVITGTIKANFPTRISFQVTSKIDSRTILGEQGAEQLLGAGDMLFMSGGGRISRVHGPFVSDEDVEKVVAHLKKQGIPQYLEAVTVGEDEDAEDSSDGSGSGGSEADQIYDKAVNIVLQDRKVSTSYIQRRLSIGYNRAATIIERMEQEGVISPANHAGKREILVGDETTAAPY